MVEILILYTILNREFTMYAIQKEIEKSFGVFSIPSFGSINPALRRLEYNGFVNSRKMMSDGGKLSIYYSITKTGVSELKRLLLEDFSDNPLQFLSNAKIKISCAELLDKDKKDELFFAVKAKALHFKTCAEKILSDEYTDKSFYQKILLDNTICEYANFITIVEGFEKDNARNS